MTITFEDNDLGWNAFVKGLKVSATRDISVGIFDTHPEIVVYVVANEFGVPRLQIPERPAWRSAFEANKDKWQTILVKGVDEVLFGKGLTYTRLYEGLAKVMESDLKASIVAWGKPANEPASLVDKQRKGQGDNPLVASGASLSAITHRITKPT